MKYIAIPNGFRLTLNKDISRRCNFKCPYCIAKNDSKSGSIFTDDVKKVISAMPTDVVLTGTGEPLMEMDKVLDILDFMKEHSPNNKVKIITNGSFADTIKGLLRKYPNVMFMRSITMTDKDGQHNNKNVIFHERVINKLLVDTDTDFSSYTYQLKHDDNFILKTLTQDGISNKLKGSFLESYLKENQDILCKMLPPHLYTHGFSIACVGNTLSLELQCMPIKFTDYFDKDNLLKSVMEYKDAMYDYMLQNYSKCCCMNDKDNLEAQLFQLYHNIKDLDTEKAITERVYEEIYSQEIDNRLDKEPINIAIDIVDSLSSVDTKLEFFTYHTLFKKDDNIFCMVPLEGLMQQEAGRLVNVYFKIENQFIVLTGIKEDLVKLLSKPNDYRLYGKIYNRLLNYLLSKILA